MASERNPDRGTRLPMAEVVTGLVCLAAFAGIYAQLQRRSGGPVRWRWLAAIVVCAAFALLLGAVIR